MKTFLALIILSIAFLSPAPAQVRAQDQKTEQELRNLVKAWDEANVKGDAVALGRLLADEFTFVDGLNKIRYLESVKSKSADSYVQSAISTEVTVQVYGDTAVVTGLDTMAGKHKGQPYSNKWRFMDVWIKRSGRWQCVKTFATLKT